jgi:mRNA interferase RelE/StbE
MRYVVALTNAAKNDLRHLDPNLQHRLAVRLQILAGTPRPTGVVKLRNRTNEWRIRVGDYRIIYEIDDNEHQVTILRISHRREAYR